MYFFIGGPPTSGKTHLATKFAEDSNLNILHIKTDTLRQNIDNPELRKWVDFSVIKTRWNIGNQQHPNNIWLIL